MDKDQTLQLDGAETEMLQYIIANYNKNIGGWWNPQDGAIYQRLLQKIKEMKP